MNNIVMKTFCVQVRRGLKIYRVAFPLALQMEVLPSSVLPGPSPIHKIEAWVFPIPKPTLSHPFKGSESSFSISSFSLWSSSNLDILKNSISLVAVRKPQN